MGPTNSAKLPDELAHMPLCAFCKRSGWEELRPGVRWRYCEHRRAGVAFDGSRWEGHGPMTEAEFGVVLEVMDARLEVVSEMRRTLVKSSDGP